MKKIVCLAFVLAVFAKVSFADTTGVGPCDQGVIVRIASATAGTFISSNSGGGYLCNIILGTGTANVDYAACMDSVPTDSARTLAPQPFTTIGQDPRMLTPFVIATTNSISASALFQSGFRGVAFTNLICWVSNAATPAFVYWKPGR